MTAFRKLPLKDRFQNLPKGSLADSITHRRYSQWSLFPSPRFLNIHPSGRLRLVCPRFQLFRKLGQLPVQVSLEPFYGDMVYPAGSAILLHLLERALKIFLPIDFINQTEPLTSFDPVFQGRQHRVCPHTRFHPVPSFPPFLGFSSLLSPFGHYRRFNFRSCFHPLFLFPVALCSTGFHRFPRYYGDSDSRPNLQHQGGYPCFTHLYFRPFRHQPPLASCCRFCTLPLSSTGFPFPGLGFVLPPQTHHVSGRTVFVISFPTDQSFTSCCSPPGVATDAVTFSYGPESVCPKRTFTALYRCAHRRTEGRCAPRQELDRLQERRSRRTAPLPQEGKAGKGKRCGAYISDTASTSIETWTPVGQRNSRTASRNTGVMALVVGALRMIWCRNWPLAFSRGAGAGPLTTTLAGNRGVRSLANSSAARRTLA